MEVPKEEVGKSENRKDIYKLTQTPRTSETIPKILTFVSSELYQERKRYTAEKTFLK